MLIQIDYSMSSLMRVNTICHSFEMCYKHHEAVNWTFSSNSDTTEFFSNDLLCWQIKG